MDRRLLWFFALLLPVTIWSWIHPHDRFTWWLESTPVVAGVPPGVSRSTNVMKLHRIGEPTTMH